MEDVTQLIAAASKSDPQAVALKKRIEEKLSLDAEVEAQVLREPLGSSNWRPLEIAEVSDDGSDEPEMQAFTPPQDLSQL